MFFKITLIAFSYAKWIPVLNKVLDTIKHIQDWAGMLLVCSVLSVIIVTVYSSTR